jgi:hypothetical protein
VLLAAMVILGTSHAFNNLGLQAELTGGTSSGRLGTAAGLFQAARFVGTALAAALVGITIAGNAGAKEWHQLCLATELLSIALLGWAAAAAKSRGEAIAREDG